MSTWVVARWNFPKRAKKNIFEQKSSENPENANNTPKRLVRRRAAFELQCCRNCTLSSSSLSGKVTCVICVYTDTSSRVNVAYYAGLLAPYPDVEFSVQLRRRALYYVLCIVLPTITLAALTLLAFLLPPDSGEKIGLGEHH